MCESESERHKKLKSGKLLSDGPDGLDWIGALINYQLLLLLFKRQKEEKEGKLHELDNILCC